MVETVNGYGQLNENLNYDSRGFTFDSTLSELSGLETEKSPKNPKENFDLFVNYLQVSPEKLNKINGNKLDAIFGFISNPENKDYVLSIYVSELKKYSFDLDNTKIKDDDKQIFLGIKKYIEETYNGNDGRGIDSWQLGQKIFTHDFGDVKLLKLGNNLDSSWSGENITANDKFQEYCEEHGVFLDNVDIFVDNFNKYNHERVNKVIKNLLDLKPGELCRTSLDSDNESKQRMKYEILDSYRNYENGGNTLMGDEFLDIFGGEILKNSNISNFITGEDEFKRIVKNDNKILQSWLSDFGKEIEKNIVNNVVAIDFEKKEFLSIEWKDEVDVYTVLSIIRRSSNQNKKDQITKFIKNGDINGLFDVVGYKSKTKVFDEKFFNLLYDYLEIPDLEYDNMGTKHKRLAKEKIYLSLGVCDTPLKSSILTIIGKENNSEEIKKLQLKLIDVDLDPANIDLQDILAVDGTIGFQTQRGISNYVGMLCEVDNDNGDMKYLMAEKTTGNIFELDGIILIGKKEGDYISGVGIKGDEELEIGKFNDQGKMFGLGVRVNIDGTREKGIYSDSQLEGTDGCRIYGNGNKEEGKFEKGHLVEGVRLENKLFEGYEVVRTGTFIQGKYLIQGKVEYNSHKTDTVTDEGFFKSGELHCENGKRVLKDGTIQEGTFENGKFIKGTQTRYENDIQIIEVGTFNEYGELDGKDCQRIIDGKEEKGIFRNGELMNEKVNSALEWALGTVKSGVRYVYGSIGPSAYDCSHFVYSAFSHAGFDIEYASTGGMKSTYEKAGFVWYKKGYKITDLKPGDILVTPGKHTEIYYGHNQIIGAHSKGGGVSLKPVDTSYIEGFSGYLRYEGTDSSK